MFDSPKKTMKEESSSTVQRLFYLCYLHVQAVEFRLVSDLGFNRRRNTERNEIAVGFYFYII